VLIYGWLRNEGDGEYEEKEERLRRSEREGSEGERGNREIKRESERDSERKRGIERERSASNILNRAQRNIAPSATDRCRLIIYANDMLMYSEQDPIDNALACDVETQAQDINMEIQVIIAQYLKFKPSPVNRSG
jgi:hypothetical protein